jgi:hypothetical protein
MGNAVVQAFVNGVEEGGGTTALEEMDWSWKGM